MSNRDAYEPHLVAAVRAEVARRGRKFHELTEPLGYSYPTVSNRLNGYSSFTLDELDKIATFLGITTADLFESAQLGRRMASGDPSPVVVEAPPVDPWEQSPRSRARRRTTD